MCESPSMTNTDRSYFLTSHGGVYHMAAPDNPGVASLCGRPPSLRFTELVPLPKHGRACRACRRAASRRRAASNPTVARYAFAEIGPSSDGMSTVVTVNGVTSSCSLSDTLADHLLSRGYVLDGAVGHFQTMDVVRVRRVEVQA